MRSILIVSIETRGERRGVQIVSGNYTDGFVAVSII